MKDVREPVTSSSVILSSIPDQQTQIAKLCLAGQTLCLASSLTLFPRCAPIQIWRYPSSRTVSFTYIQFDAKNRSGVDVFKDKRVREALLMAIDRPGLVKAFVPAGTSERQASAIDVLRMAHRLRVLARPGQIRSGCSQEVVDGSRISQRL